MEWNYLKRYTIYVLAFVTVLSVVSMVSLTGRLFSYVCTKCARSNSKGVQYDFSII